MADVFEKPSVERLVTSSVYIMGFGVLAGIMGWIVIIITSRSDIGVGPKLLGFLNTAMALNIIGGCISGGFNQALSKYISESLVESREKALIYAKSGFLLLNLVGIVFFSIFMILCLWNLPNHFENSVIYGVMAIVYYLVFFNSIFTGSIAAVHRFDYLGKISFGASLVGAVVALGILFFIPKPLNAVLLPLMLLATIIGSLLLVFIYGKKSVPYSFSSFFRGAHQKNAVQIFKYGLYCAIPNIIYTSAILWIQTLWFSGLLGFSSIVVGANGVIIGYASVALAICQMGAPQIPAISEAKAMKDYKLIDNYMKTTLHNGFNMTLFLVTIYIGISYIVLYLLHGPEYIFAQIPFILLSIAVAILGIEFLVCTLLIGLGEGKKAAILILSLTLIQIVLVPLLIIFLNNIFGIETTLYAGSSSLLISSIAILPIAFRYMIKYTRTPSKTYLAILGKATLSMILALSCFGLLEWLVFPHSLEIIDLAIGLVVRGAILFGLFIFFMLIFAGLNDADLDFYSKSVGPLHILIKPMRNLLHHSPFYHEENKISNDNPIL